MHTVEGEVTLPFYSRVDLLDVKREVFARYGVKMDTTFVGGFIKKKYKVVLVGPMKELYKAMDYIYEKVG